MRTLYDRLYRSLYRIRRVEEEIVATYPTDKIKSPVHLSIGQESVSVGVCEALCQEDVVFGTYRGHAMYLAKGGDLPGMIAELYGKSTGVAKGKGGSMHLIDVPHGIMGTSAVVGTTIPQAVGYALAIKTLGKKSIVVSFFGDGAVEEGVFYESVNFAVLKSLPIIFVCENNLYAINTNQQERQGMDADICNRVKALGVPTFRIEDDVLEIYEQVSETVKDIRAGQLGPYFFECMTYRWKQHVGPNEDFDLGYRSREEAEPWIKNDQVERIGSLLDGYNREKIEKAVDAEIADAFDFAECSPYPLDSELFTEVFYGR